jgi:uncharacterized protein YhaN
MDREALKDSLTRLHSELESVNQLDPELAGLVEQLDEDIERLMQGREEEIADSFADRVEEMAAEFTARHPRLAPILREIGDTLARMGI